VEAIIQKYILVQREKNKLIIKLITEELADFSLYPYKQGANKLTEAILVQV
jgi:ABC-type enterochelin transport system ATPase subunit